VLGTQVVEQGSRPSLLQQQRLGLDSQVQNLHTTEPENDGESIQTKSGAAAHLISNKLAPSPRISLIIRKQSAQDYEWDDCAFTVNVTKTETL